MADKNKNLIPQAHKLTVDEQSKGGKAGAKARRDKKTVRELLKKCVNGKVKDNEQLTGIAEELGISTKKSVKELATFIYLMNSLQKGDLTSLEKLAQLLGEEIEASAEETEEDNSFIEALNGKADVWNDSEQ